MAATVRHSICSLGRMAGRALTQRTLIEKCGGSGRVTKMKRPEGVSIEQRPSCEAPEELVGDLDGAIGAMRGDACQGRGERLK